MQRNAAVKRSTRHLLMSCFSQRQSLRWRSTWQSNPHCFGIAVTIIEPFWKKVQIDVLKTWYNSLATPTASVEALPTRMTRLRRPSLYSRGSEHVAVVRRVWENVDAQLGCHTWKRRGHCSNGRSFFLQRASHDVGAHSWRHGTCTTSVCQHASGLCRLFDVSLSSRSLCLLSLIQNLSVVPSRLAATSLAAPRHPLHPPSPEPGITVAFTREFVVFICFSPFFTWSVPFCFHSVPVSYLAASPMAPPGRLWLSHLLPAKKAQGQKAETALRDFCNVLQCSTMFYNVLQCSTMFYNVLPCSTMFYNALQCSTVLQCSTCFIMFLHL